MVKAKYLKLGKQVLVEFKKRSKNSDPRKAVDVIDEILTDLGYEPKWITSGIARTAFLLDDDVIIKIPGTIKYDSARVKDMVAETNYIRKMRRHKKYGRHFPDTVSVRHGGFILQVQEKIPLVGGKLCYKYIGEVEQLAVVLGIDDVHEGNYGWKGTKGKEYPVFIDVDFRSENRINPPKRIKVRSWWVRPA